jgi:excisionase family DNA binding protein
MPQTNARTSLLASEQMSVAKHRTADFEVMTVQELAAHLDLSTSTVYRNVRLGYFPAFRVGRRWRVNLRSLEDYLIESYERKTGCK